MDDSLYIWPAGLLHGRDAREAVHGNKAGVIAGGAVAFTMAEVVHRCTGTGEIARHWKSWPELVREAGGNAELAGLLAHIGAKRAPLAGFDWSRTLVMGIVNVTPDSFSDGGRFIDAESAIAHGRALAAQGADILDVGGESTRPGAEEIAVEEEMARVVPVVKALAAEGFVVSIDTRKAQVMEAAIAAGAAIVNDVSALSFDAGAPGIVARAGVPVVLMHARGTPADMQDSPEYEDVALDVFDELAGRIEAAVSAGVQRDNIIVDPGIGFGKTVEHNLELMRRIAIFHGLGAPVLLGASRKSFIGAVTGIETPQERLAGSLAAAAQAAGAGVQIVRVHDVGETKCMLRMYESWQDT